MTLPVISLDEVDKAGSAAQAMLRTATHEFGFFHLVDHGAPESLQRELLDVSRALFALPSADKAATT